MSDLRQARVNSSISASPAKLNTRAPTKLTAITQALQREKGASIADLVAITGWKVRTIRGVIAGTLKYRHRLAITSVKIEDVRIYRAKAAIPMTRSNP